MSDLGTDGVFGLRLGVRTRGPAGRSARAGTRHPTGLVGLRPVSTTGGLWREGSRETQTDPGVPGETERDAARGVGREEDGTAPTGRWGRRRGPGRRNVRRYVGDRTTATSGETKVDLAGATS